MSAQALNPRAWLLVVLGLWAMLASAATIFVSYRHATTLGKLERSAQQLVEAEAVNKTNALIVSDLRADLDLCEAEFAEVKTTAEQDRARRAEQIRALSERVQGLKYELANDLQDGTPELRACDPVPIPGAALERLRDAADNAIRAGRGRQARLDAGPGR